jgi:hypothetical protein
MRGPVTADNSSSTPAFWATSTGSGPALRGLTTSTGYGLEAISHGSGSSIRAFSDGTGTAVEAVSTGSAPAIKATPAGNTEVDEAIRITGGTVKFTGANMGATVGFLNQLVAANIVKAWGFVALSGGSASLITGFNLAASTPLVLVAGAAGKQNLRVKFNQPMATADYAPFVMATNPGGTSVPAATLASSQNHLTTSFEITAVTTNTGTQLDMVSYTGSFVFVVLGLQ